MFRNISSFKYSHDKLIYFRCLGISKVILRQKSTGASICRTLSARKTVSNCLHDYKYLQFMIKKSKFQQLQILRRSLSTGSVYFNKEPNNSNSDGNKDNKENEPDNKENIKRFMRRFMIFFIFYIVLDAIISSTKSPVQEDLFISWEEFRHEMLAKGEVEKLVVGDGDIVVIFLHKGANIKNKPARYNIYFMNYPEISKFEERLRDTERQLGISPQDGVPVQYQKPSVLSKLITLLPILLLFLIPFKSKNFKISQLSHLMSFKKAKFTLVDPLAGQGRGVKFSDVAGLKEAKVEIMEFVDYLKRPEHYKSLGAKVPKGALLLGPPGCGKTLLAKAVATEANVPFLSMNGSEFVEMISGLGAARVRDLFKEAKKRIPCIVYIDEIDAIGRKRSSGNMDRGDREGEQTLNQLLVEMDGMVSNEGVILIASTNRADVLDSALRRPGRFDREIFIDLPTAEERKEIFEQHLKSIHLEQEPKFYSKRMAQLTPGFSGADIANVCNEAALHAARLKKQVVQADDLEYAVERVVGGTEKRSSVLSKEEKEMLAFNEAGRALVGWLSKYGKALLKITIVSRTDSPAGWTQFSPEEKFLFSKEELMGNMCMGLGGRVAISLVFNRVTTSGNKDLKKVTRVAYAQIREFGMNDKVGLISFDPQSTKGNTAKPYSKQLATLIDQEARNLVAKAYKETETILRENKDKLHKLAAELLKRETLNYDEVVLLLGPPPHAGKKVIDPFDFERDLNKVAGPERPPTPPPRPSEKVEKESEQ